MPNTNSTDPFYIVFANGSRILGAPGLGDVDLEIALEAARRVEAGSGVLAVRIIQGAVTILEGDALRRALQ
ncbi:MAG: hypothetical protein M0Z51_05395 [Propionibacterium sp.]|nr:hypothetical protein [Propionibacterium sp.]